MDYLFIHSVDITEKEIDGNIVCGGSCGLRVRPLDSHDYFVPCFFEEYAPNKNCENIFKFLTGETVQLRFSLVIAPDKLDVLTQEAFNRLLLSENFFARSFHGRKIRMEYVGDSLELTNPTEDELDYCDNFFGSEEFYEDTSSLRLYRYKVNFTLLDPIVPSENLEQIYREGTVLFVKGDPEEKLLQIYRDYFEIEKKLVVPDDASRICVGMDADELMVLQKEILESNDERLSLSEYLTLLECMGISGIDDSAKDEELRNNSDAMVKFCWDYALEKMNVGDYGFVYNYGAHRILPFDKAVPALDKHVDLLGKVMPLLDQFEEEFKASGESDKAKFFARRFVEKIQMDPVSYTEIPNFVNSDKMLRNVKLLSEPFACLAKKLLV